VIKDAVAAPWMLLLLLLLLVLIATLHQARNRD